MRTLVASEANVISAQAVRRGIGAITVVTTKLFEKTAAVFRSVLVDVRADQLKLPTPCAPLNVAQLVEKAIGHQDWLLAALQGVQAPPEYPYLDPADYVDAFERSTAAMVAELQTDGAMSRTVALAPSVTFSGSDVKIGRAHV
jgi:hypothetical protein